MGPCPHLATGQASPPLQRDLLENGNPTECAGAASPRRMTPLITQARPDLATAGNTELRFHLLPAPVSGTPTGSSSGPLLPSPGQGRRLEDQVAKEARDAPASGMGPGLQLPLEAQDLQGVEGHDLYPQHWPGICCPSPTPCPPPSSKSCSWDQGLGSPTCTRISVMCTYMCPAWATRAARVYLRADACCVYMPATCTEHGVYTMDSGLRAPQVCMCTLARA